MFIGQLIAGAGFFAARPAPQLTGVSATVTQNPDCSANDWRIQISWTTSNPNDSGYDLRVDYCAANGCDPTTGTPTNLVSGLSTADGNTTDATGVTGLIGGGNPVDWFRTYRVYIVRASDSFIISSMNTSQVTVTVGDCI